MTRRPQQQRGWSDDDGFTLIEALISTVLMAVILGALAMVTAQWMPNWSRGFARVQQTDLTAGGLERIVADLSDAEFIPPKGNGKGPLFDGTAVSVVFVRSAVGPNTQPGLEFVRIGETADEQGLAMVRMRARFVPITAAALDQISFVDPVVLVRAPYRVSFAFAGSDRRWRDSWRGEKQLPNAIRFTLRDAATAQPLAVSTAAIIHVDAPADCVRLKDRGYCATASGSADE